MTHPYTRLYRSTTAPSVSDDNTLGYEIGDIVVDQVANQSYQAFDVSTGAAVWVELTGSGGGSPDWGDIGGNIVDQADLQAELDAKASTTYVDSAVVGLIDFKGATDCSANPNYPAALKGDAYVVSVAGKIGGASGKSVDAGDVFVATADNAGGTEASVGTSWVVLEHNLVGSVIGPASAVDDRIATFDGATGKLIQDGGATVASLGTGAQINAASEEDEIDIAGGSYIGYRESVSGLLKKVSALNLFFQIADWLASYFADVSDFSSHNHDAGAGDAPKLAQANTHQSPDTDTAAGSLHHTIGAGANQAAAGNHAHEVDQRADMWNDAEGDPAAIGTAADGVSTYGARRDHVHAITNGESVLGSVFNITGAAGAFQDTGLSVTLPSAGTYRITANVRGNLRGNGGAGTTAWWLTSQLYNSTDAAVVANSERLIVLTGTNAVTFQTTVPIDAIVTVAASKVIKLYAARNGNGTPAWTSTNIESGADGRTVLSYEKIG